MDRKIRTFGTVLNGINKHQQQQERSIDPSIIVKPASISIRADKKSMVSNGTENIAVSDKPAKQPKHQQHGDCKMTVEKKIIVPQQSNAERISKKNIKKKEENNKKKKAANVQKKKLPAKPVPDAELARKWMTAADPETLDRDYHLLQLRCTFETWLKASKENERLKRDIETARQKNQCLETLKTEMELLYQDLFDDQN